MLKVAIFALIFALAGTAQTPLGSISGSVTNLAGEPVPGATLRLFVHREDTVQVAYSVFSDAKGLFTFEDMNAGTYSVCSDKPGYLYACHTDSAKRQAFTLAAGQTLTGIDIKAAAQAVISGRITDENGDPFPNVQVVPAHWEYRNGQKQIQQAGGNAISNVEGEFSIGSLAAGSYLVLAIPRPSSSTNAVYKGPQETYLTTYYPAVTDPSKAVAVQVPAGGAVRGVEIRTGKTRAYRVRGKLVAPAGGVLPPNSGVQLVPDGGPPPDTATLSARDGVFDFEGVLPGVYFLEVRVTSGMARQKVSVGNADVNDVIVQLAPGTELTGTISIDGAALPMESKPVVQLTVAARVGCCGAEQASENGTFTIHNITPGRYRAGVERSLPAGTYVKSIRLGDRDVTKTPFDLTSGDAATLHIVLSPNAGDIAAVVHDADGLPHPGMNLSLWTPGIPAEGAPDFTRLSYTDVNGKFKFTNLPPGEYRIAAWEEDDFYRLMEPELRVKLEGRAAAVRLDENQHLTVEVPIIGRDIVDAEAAKLQ